MLLAAKFDFARMMPTETESAFEYWMSMSPAAPMFGVRWRFADIVYGETEAPEAPAKPKAKKAAKPKATPAPVAVEAEVVAEVPAPAPEPVEEVAAPAPALEVAPAPAEEAAPAAVAKKPAAKKPAAKKAEPLPVDDLTVIKGIGPKMAGALEAEGITSFRQIAAWNPAEVGPLESKIGSLPGRILRDDWIGQAKSLAG